MITALGAGLFVLHGLEARVGFRVDSISLGCLAIAALPLVAEHLESLKVGDVEARFKRLGLTEQVFTFLEAIAVDRQLTFYTPRSGEHRLGEVGLLLNKEMLETDRPEAVARLRQWLRGDEPNLKWLAAEVAGFMHVTELMGDLRELYVGIASEKDWPPWRLNALWSHSKVARTPQELGDFLVETKSKSNQSWVIEALRQMREDEDPDFKDYDVRGCLTRLLERGELETAIEASVRTELEQRG